MTGSLADGFDTFGDRVWLNTAHQGALPRAAADAAREAISWKLRPHELTMERFTGVPRRLRAALARLVNAPPQEIVLANSASYGLHLLANAYPWVAGDEILVMAGDFPSDILPWLLAEQRHGVQVRRIRPRERVVSADELRAAVTPRTRLFCTPWVHSFSGYAADLDTLGDVCRDNRVFLVVNGSQAVGARPIDVSATPVDALISVGFKWLCGPYGTGFAWLRRALRERLTRVKAYWLSQLSQADLARDDLDVALPDRAGSRDLDIFGTANFNNYVPWTVAVEHLLDLGMDRVRTHDDRLVGRLVAGLDHAGMRLLSPADPERRSSLVFFTHPDRARNADLHAALAAAGVDVALRGGSLRASPHLYNTDDHIDRLLDTLRDPAFR
jgi:selenocysteine lyase/cysteine desulfurase